jgi:predicted hotdog family 3-hydroxylacyl-ACP dehydratase
MPNPDSNPLLPHTGNARLLTEVLTVGHDFVNAVGCVRAGHPLVVRGRAPGILGLELAAQAAAAMEASVAGSQCQGLGYLVRVPEAVFLSPDLPVDTPLMVTARVHGLAPPLAVYRICVSVGGVESVRATLSTYRP